MTTETPSVLLKAGHVQPVWAGHPWVFAQAIQRIDGSPAPGAEVIVRDAKGQALGRGLYSPKSAIPVRLFTRDAGRALDDGLVAERVDAALGRRARMGLPSEATTGFRLLHAEGDQLPGLIVDRLGDVLCVQFGTLGMKQRESMVLSVLRDRLEPRAIVDRSSLRAAQLEGFAAASGVLFGSDSLDRFAFLERGLSYDIPLALGQKTGFYFDQRPLRERVEQLASGRRVLDAYGYVGAVALSAARGGALEVISVDSSGPAIEVARNIAARNGLADSVRFVQGDAVQELERSQDGYDLVVCDPPKLAPTRQATRRAVGVMRRLAALGARATRAGGHLVVCSCSAAIGAADLARAAALGAVDVGRQATVLERWFQGPDHPVPGAFPEGMYLSSLLLEVGRR